MKFACRTTCLIFIGLLPLIASCSSINLWPFGESKPPSASRGPENATEYRCDAGKSFYVRFLDAGKSAWVILPDRQVRLDKVSAESGERYTNGIAVLHVDASGAVLNDGPNIAFTACKSGGVTSK